MTENDDRLAEMVRLAIIGPGKVGIALGVLAARAGWPVVAVGGRDSDRTSKAAEIISSEARPCTPAQAAAQGQLVLLTVSDDAIQPVCDELAEAGAFRPGTIVAHCCGALDSEILSSAAKKCSCLPVSMHPLQTFPTVDSAIEKLPGAHFFCQGSDCALAVVKKFIADIGGIPVRIEEGKAAKALYHAGAVMACNYLSALVDAALTLMAEAGLDRQRSLDALGPLVSATVQNVLTIGPEAALTGPIARGDLETVRRHLQTIDGRAGLEGAADFYRAAGRWTVSLAQRKGEIDDPTAAALEKLLDGPTQQQ